LLVIIKLFKIIDKIIKNEEIIWIRKNKKIIFLLFIYILRRKMNRKFEISKKNQIIKRSLINNDMYEKIIILIKMVTDKISLKIILDN